MVSLPKHTASDPVVPRRNKLITRIQQQIALAKDPNSKISRQRWVKGEDGTKTLQEVQKRVRPWWRADQTGRILLAIHYGACTIELSKGMHAIVVGAKERLVGVLEQVIAVVEEGSLDTILAQMSKTAVQTKGKKPA